jgi:micrococcal nuclease
MYKRTRYRNGDETGGRGRHVSGGATIGKRAAALLVVAQCLIAATASGRPDCAGPIEISAATIVRVERNGALILRDGRAAHLEGIRLPAGSNDHAPQFLADQALAALIQLTVGRRLDLAAVPPKEDRYDRVRAQAFHDDEWVQSELLRRGLARVSIAPDRIECADELYAAEKGARAKRTGLWSSSAYAIRGPADVVRDSGTFQIIEGRVEAADVKDGQAWLDFESARRERAAAVILPDDLRTYRRMGVDPRGYVGKTVRIRGFVQNLPSGPAIAIANPIQVEVVQ